MAVSASFRAFVVELFSAFGTVRVRPMFGAAGIYFGDVMFGVVDEDRVYLKAGPRTRPTFEAENLQPFTFVSSKGESVVTSYFALPDRLYDDGDELAQWARRAYDDAAERVAAKRRPKKARKTKTARQPVKRRKRS